MMAKCLKLEKLTREKCDKSSGVTTVLNNHQAPYTDNQIPPFTVGELEELIKVELPRLPDSVVTELVRDSMSPLADRQLLCIRWLERYFTDFADISPNSFYHKVSITFKKDLYLEYKKEIQKHADVVTLSRFYELWCVLFPYCVNRPWCNVPGKCETCFMISQARNAQFQDHLTQKLLQQLHAIHRGGLFMRERAAYKDRVLAVLSQNPQHKTKMSIIIDGMDQSHCACPYYGSQNSFSDAITQHITAVKEHGHGVTIYRTLGTVSKGANLTIYCILAQIESWRIRNGNRYPEELYLQLDGGSENANKYLIGMLELLVYKRLIKKIYFTRLPTGHTHEDIGNKSNIVFMFEYRMSSLCFRCCVCCYMENSEKQRGVDS
jgi:hypothetical protein